ncbi:MAG: hypothetical protein OXT65_07135 [Alphaproteobacteria bacterium]|nr:hypothetical protein [Alphaproteobacteria bacterium]
MKDKKDGIFHRFGRMLKRILKPPVSFDFKKKRLKIRAKRTLALLGGWFLFMSSFIHVFPRAEQKLEEHNLSADIAAEFAPDKNIHITTDTTPGRIAILGSSIMYPSSVINRIDHFKNERVAAFAVSSISGIFNDTCGIYLKENLPKSNLNKKLGLSDQDVNAYYLLHEIRHCGQTGMDHFTQEADADYHAITRLAKERNDSEMVGRFINYQALYLTKEDDTLSIEHDTVLYLDLKRRNMPIPPTEDIYAANLAAANLIRTALTQELDVTGDEFMQQHDALSPLAQRRVSLWVQAVLQKNQLPPAAVSQNRAVSPQAQGPKAA